MNCPHCKTELTPHEVDEGLAKYGALHCDGCGCCFQADGETPREGVPVCAQEPVEEAELDETPATPAPRRRGRA